MVHLLNFLSDNFGITFILVGLPVYIGYNYHSEIYNYIQKTSLYQSARTTINAKVTEIILEDAKHRKDVGLKVNAGNKTATITYRQHGSNKQVHVPYNRKLVSKMAGVKVYLIDEVGTKRDVTTKAGVPFTLTASELGGKHYEISRLGEISVLEPDEIPFSQ